jgi:hypothetical protein
MSSIKKNLAKKRTMRLIASMGLSVILFLIIHFIIPHIEPDPHPTKTLIKNLFFSSVFGFLPFYILPWLRWIMGHENDTEKNMDGEPKAELEEDLNKQEPSK